MLERKESRETGLTIALEVFLLFVCFNSDVTIACLKADGNVIMHVTAFMTVGAMAWITDLGMF